MRGLRPERSRDRISPAVIWRRDPQDRRRSSEDAPLHRCLGCGSWRAAEAAMRLRAAALRRPRGWHSPARERPAALYTNNYAFPCIKRIPFLVIAHSVYCARWHAFKRFHRIGKISQARFRLGGCATSSLFKHDCESSGRFEATLLKNLFACASEQVFLIV
jgi:hypothetical protein